MALLSEDHEHRSATPPTRRHRPDRCPGVLRPWVAEDGALLRVRLAGGRLHRQQLAGLAALAEEYGDGRLHLTVRANLQLRGVALPVPDRLVDRIEALGLLPSRTHERVRNVIASPLTGRVGGVADLRPVVTALDEAIRADPALADLPARFLFCLDDRGDLHDQPADLSAVAVAPDRARLWAGGLAGETVPLGAVAGSLVALARRFLRLRGEGPTARWHVAELDGGGDALGDFRPGASRPACAPPPPGRLTQDDGRRARHLVVPSGSLAPEVLDDVHATAGEEVVVTPWRSLLLPDLETGP
jgi:precorrin-3B synthase